MRTEEQVIWCQAAITTVSQAIPISPFKITDEHAALQKDPLIRLVESQHLSAQIQDRIVTNRAVGTLADTTVRPVASH